MLANVTVGSYILSGAIAKTGVNGFSGSSKCAGIRYPKVGTNCDGERATMVGKQARQVEHAKDSQASELTSRRERRRGNLKK